MNRTKSIDIFNMKRYNGFIMNRKGVKTTMKINSQKIELMAAKQGMTVTDLARAMKMTYQNFNTVRPAVAVAKRLRLYALLAL